MNRSNAPPPIRTSATPASGGGYKNNYPPSNDFGHRDANNNSAYQQYSGYDDTTNNISGYDDPNAAEQHNNNMMMMPTSSAMRQGRFAPGPDPTNNMNSVNTAAQLEPPQQHQQQQFNSASSQVTFHSGAAPPQPTSADTLQQNMESSSNFMFDEMEDFQHYMNNTPHSNNNNDTNTANTTNHGGIPTETQLTLLCLDYLRSLRRSYHANPQDLYHGEGLDADYLSLAIWSLSRAFVAPGKLKFEKAKGSSVLEEDDDMDNGVNKKGKKKKSSSKSGGMVKEICIVGGGGLAGVEDECVGNDSVYRLDVRTKRQQHDDDDGDDDDNNNNNNSNEIDTSSTEVFALTKDIKLPSMTDITKEVLLSYNNNNDDDDAATNNDEDESPIYEQNDMHLSNSHRFYLFNGMASGDDSQGMMGGGGGGGGAAGAATKKSAGPSIIDGGPLTLTDLASVALSTLNAKSRIEAEREVVSDPLFESFIKAASEKGFFTESKLEGKDTLSPEAEEHRQRLLYENKYRKVVAKFRSKLAVREEQQMLHHGGGFGGGAYVGSGGWSPRSGQRAMNNVHSVSDRLEMRRDRIINEVKEYRLEGEEGEEDPFVPHLVCEEQQQQQFQKVQREQLLDIVADYAREKQIVRDLVSPRARSEPFKGFKEFQSNNAKVAERMTEEEEEEDGFIPMNPSSQVDEAPPTPVDEAPPTPVAYQMNPSFPVDEAPPTPMASSFATPRTTTMDPPSSSSPKVPPNYQEAESMNAQGNELMQKKQFNQALEMYTTALKISPAGPNSHAYYSNRSAAHLSLGDAESSIRDSQMALTIRPDYAKAHSRLGLAHYASGRYQEAVDSYEAALDLEPDNVWVMKKYDKVKKVLAKVQNEKDKEAVTRDEEGGGSVSPFAGTMIDEAAKRKGAEIVRQADEYKDAGNAFMKDKNFEDALDQYNIAIGISPDGPNSHIYYSNRAAAYCYLGQYSEAADDCLSSIALNETYEKAYSRYGLSLFFLGDYEGSIDAYGKSLELAPDNKASLSYLAKAKARLAAQQENEMQEYMAKKLNLSNESEEKPVAGREEEIQQDLGFREEISVARREEEIYQNVHAEEGFFSKNGLSQSRDDDGEGIEASYSGMKGPGQFEKGYDPPGEIMKTYSPFDEEEGDEI